MKKLLLLLLVATTALTSCEDFLNQVPESSRTSGNFYQTRADFYNALVGSYNDLKRAGVYANGSGSLMVLQEMASDNSTFTPTRQPVNSSIFEIDDLLFTKSNTVIQTAWTDHYIGIGRTNQILANLPNATFLPADKDRFEGEARFLRALYYVNLVRLFGDLQIVTEPISDPYATANLQRAPKEEVYKLIISDLSVAAAKLPTTIPATEAGRASQWAAKALLGKVYLTQAQWAQALPVLKDVNDNSARTLMTSYSAVFAATTAYAANTEVIFAVQYKSGLLLQGAPGTSAVTQGGVGVTQGSDMWSNWAPMGSGSLLGPNGGGGGGFNTPTTDLINAYEAGDVRKNATVLTSYTSGTTVVSTFPYVVKFRQQGAVSNDSDVDFPILRFADVVLMYAESLNEQGQTADALTQLNRVRTRAGLKALTGLDQAGLRLAIEQERRVELAFENHRWPDLVRTNRHVPVLSAKNYPVKDFQRLYPVPQRETDLNSKLSQNPGY